MAERAIILEGPSGSGKTTAAEELAKRGFVVVHGVPSQYPEVNETLSYKSRELIKGLDFNFAKSLKLPIDQGIDLMGRSIRVWDIQESVGMSAANFSPTIFENSILRLIALNDVVASIALQNGDKELMTWGKKMATATRSAAPLAGISGIVLLERPLEPMKQNSSMAEYSALETYFLNKVVDEFELTYGIPVRRIDPNQNPDSIPDRLDSFYRFNALRIFGRPQIQPVHLEAALV